MVQFKRLEWNSETDLICGTEIYTPKTNAKWDSEFLATVQHISIIILQVV